MGFSFGSSTMEVNADLLRPTFLMSALDFPGQVSHFISGLSVRPNCAVSIINTFMVLLYQVWRVAHFGLVHRGMQSAGPNLFSPGSFS